MLTMASLSQSVWFDSKKKKKKKIKVGSMVKHEMRESEKGGLNQ